jgi:hypothetical protein
MMLEQLLSKVHAGGTLETGKLASEFGVPIELIEAMLEHLQRQGAIQEYVRCTDGCAGCSLRSDCASPVHYAPRVWHGVV